MWNRCLPFMVNRWNIGVSGRPRWLRLRLVQSGNLHPRRVWLIADLRCQVTRKLGVPALKQAMEWFGFHGGASRSPLQPLTEAETQQLRRDFSSNGWL